MRNILLLVSLFMALNAIVQHTYKVDTIMMLKQVPGEGILLDKGWRFKAGDDLQWARPGLNVNDWQPIDPH
jgi:hypothetical protein